MKITLYTAPGCGPCLATKHAMSLRGIPFDLVDLRDDPDAMERVKALGYRSAPVVVVEDGDSVQHWTGFQLDLLTDLCARVSLMGDAA